MSLVSPPVAFQDTVWLVMVSGGCVASLLTHRLLLFRPFGTFSWEVASGGISESMQRAYHKFIIQARRPRRGPPYPAIPVSSLLDFCLRKLPYVVSDSRVLRPKPHREVQLYKGGKPVQKDVWAGIVQQHYYCAKNVHFREIKGTHHIPTITEQCPYHLC